MASKLAQIPWPLFLLDLELFIIFLPEILAVEDIKQLKSRFINVFDNNVCNIYLKIFIFYFNLKFEIINLEIICEISFS